MRELDLQLDNGQTLHAYDAGGPDAGGRLAVFWHHGTPNIGSPPEPLFEAATRLGVRWVSYDRPGYGGSSSRPGRQIGSTAEYAAAVADALGIDQFAVMGHSGGGSHALACAALLPQRVLAVVSAAGLAPFGSEHLDWFAGMAASGVASLRAAAEGCEAKERYEASGVEYDPEFTPADRKALAGEWAWLGSVADAAMKGGSGGLVDDDLAYVAAWGCEPGQIMAPTLLLHGGADRVVPSSHSEWLERRIATAELRLLPKDGHISVLNSAVAALDWIRAHVT